MKIREAMTPEVEFIDPNATISDAAVRMKERNIGSLPVGENDRLIGMITDRDIAIRSAAEGLDPGSSTIREVMSESIIYAFEDQDLGEAATLMKENKVRRLVVLNREKRMVGLISLGDLVTRAKDKAIAGAVLEAVAHTPRPTGA